MPKKDTKTSKKQPKKLLRLPRSKNGVRREGRIGGSCYKYQQAELAARAKRANMTTSYYLNYLLWKDKLRLRDIEE